MEKWRPEEWDDIEGHITHTLYEKYKGKDCLILAIALAVEAGADAMLAVLTEGGEHFPGNFKTIHFPTLMPAGYFIFIPDEENGE